MKQYNKPRQSNTVWPGLYGDDPLTKVRLPHSFVCFVGVWRHFQYK